MKPKSNGQKRPLFRPEAKLKTTGIHDLRPFGSVAGMLTRPGGGGGITHPNQAIGKAGRSRRKKGGK